MFGWLRLIDSLGLRLGWLSWLNLVVHLLDSDKNLTGRLELLQEHEQIFRKQKHPTQGHFGLDDYFFLQTTKTSSFLTIRVLTHPPWPSQHLMPSQPRAKQLSEEPNLGPSTCFCTTLSSSFSGSFRSVFSFCQSMVDFLLAALWERGVADFTGKTNAQV